MLCRCASSARLLRSTQAVSARALAVYVGVGCFRAQEQQQKAVGSVAQAQAPRSLPKVHAALSLAYFAACLPTEQLLVSHLQAPNLKGSRFLRAQRFVYDTSESV